LFIKDSGVKNIGGALSPLDRDFFFISIRTIESYSISVSSLVKAVPAVNRSSFCWFERHFGFLSAVGTNCFVHFPRWSVESAAIPSFSVHYLYLCPPKRDDGVGLTPIYTLGKNWREKNPSGMIIRLLLFDVAVLKNLFILECLLYGSIEYGNGIIARLTERKSI